MSAIDRLWGSVFWCSLCASAIEVTPFGVSSLETRRAQQPQPPVIVKFAINDTASTVHKSAAALQLVHALAGTKPVEYRVSVRADFQNALWLPYTAPIQLTGWQGFVQGSTHCDGRANGHRLQLFLQVRSDLGGMVNIVNGQRVVVPQKIESNVVSDAICVLDDR